MVHYTAPLMDRQPDTRSSETSGVARDGASRTPAGSAVDAAVVSSSGGEGAVYLMYAAEALSAEGAFLTGGLLLEIGEEVLLELRLSEHGALRARARVAEMVPAPRAAMRVVFIGLSEADRTRLARRTATPTP